MKMEPRGIVNIWELGTPVSDFPPAVAVYNFETAAEILATPIPDKPLWRREAGSEPKREDFGPEFDMDAFDAYITAAELWRVVKRDCELTDAEKTATLQALNEVKQFVAPAKEEPQLESRAELQRKMSALYLPRIDCAAPHIHNPSDDPCQQNYIKNIEEVTRQIHLIDKRNMEDQIHAYLDLQA